MAYIPPRSPTGGTHDDIGWSLHAHAEAHKKLFTLDASLYYCASNDALSSGRNRRDRKRFDNFFEETVGMPSKPKRSS